MRFSVLRALDDDVVVPAKVVLKAEEKEGWEPRLFVNAVKDTVLGTGIDLDQYEPGERVGTVETNAMGEVGVTLG